MKIINLIALILVIVGGLNWLLFAFDFNLVHAIFGATILAKIVYVLVGLSALWMLGNFKKHM
tara:strand:- start:4753 stop:4938 length:186 start_codon:yes stop_codon:yes gene_type:complete